MYLKTEIIVALKKKIQYQNYFSCIYNTYLYINKTMLISFLNYSQTSISLPTK